MRRLQVYRWHPEDGDNPRLDTYFVDATRSGLMVLDALLCKAPCNHRHCRIKQRAVRAFIVASPEAVLSKMHQQSLPWAAPAKS